jgi:cation transport ATPase
MRHVIARNLLLDLMQGGAHRIDLRQDVNAGVVPLLQHGKRANTAGVPIAAGVLYPASGLLLSPMLAALAMSLSSVIASALRLRTVRP